ncbi:MAG: hypothetical protein RLZZ142_2697 [Verrucomicrobiota bacterium]
MSVPYGVDFSQHRMGLPFVEGRKPLGLGELVLSDHDALGIELEEALEGEARP